MNLDRVYTDKGNYKNGIKWYEKSFEIMIEPMNSNDSSNDNVYRKK